ncbi:DNA-binding response regulator, NarL/FixJ family, contains REC and HTH domains [Nonomuraea maritima]|uniref:DNA-binding response regulator, NarL/FixJ family, contains REC and HTH domains n=1 Tax=Nonomuraea maritima TaxID=683260 RepID=A0A1G8WEA5_9ACTN|nr:LuxR family transcriptional regulator [Nonomuraea maritima]SDJ75850.1 DNA-binding response regulator, NarL/FixJ family, contains REC and HTH domains [Nonomuraea maritima]
MLITVRGDVELVARAGHLFDGVTREFVCAARDLATWAQPRAREAVARRVAAVPGRVEVRKLLSPAALAGEEARSHLRRLAAAGTQVRISSRPFPYETIVIDRTYAITAGEAAAGAREYTVTDEPSLVGGVCSLLDGVWEAATELGAYLGTDRPHLDDAERAVLRTLSLGHTDEAAARQLGLSVRTYRRRVAALLATLDAETRFQAGRRAGELGLTT